MKIKESFIWIGTRNLYYGYIHPSIKTTKLWLHRYSDAKAVFDRFKNETGGGNDNTTPRMKDILKDMVHTKYRYGYDYDEYFLYHFSERSLPERRMFVSDKERTQICDRMNCPENKILFDDKEKAYEIFKKYYKRDLIKVSNLDDKQKFFDFIQLHQKAIVKPYNGWCGLGIQIIDFKVEQTDKIFEKLLELYQSGFVIEELVNQCETIKKLHPQSLNTVRMTTIRFDDHIEIIHPFLRVGRKDSVVDNAGSGGIIANVDAKSGMVTCAADELGKQYNIHPDTGEKIVGFQIPRWEEAKKLAKVLASVIPSNRYTGWDLALTDDGWVMIEGNARGQFVFQIPSQVGFRPEIEAILEKMQK